jgi:hypothetical protein
VGAFMVKSAYKCNSCKKLTGDTANEHSISKSNQKEALFMETECTALRIVGDDLSTCSW